MHSSLKSLEAQPYHEALARGELLLQVCDDCHRLRHPPSAMCPACQSVRTRWQKSQGQGSVHSAVTIHHSSLPGFAERTPYTMLTVTLDEQVRLLAPLAFAATEVPAIGARVALEFISPSDGSLLPTFKVVSS